MPGGNDARAPDPAPLRAGSRLACRFRSSFPVGRFLCVLLLPHAFILACRGLIWNSQFSSRGMPMSDTFQSAPEFTLPRDGGDSVTLSALRPRAVVLFFYPRDDTSGCTKEAVAFSGLQAE